MLHDLHGDANTSFRSTGFADEPVDFLEEVYASQPQPTPAELDAMYQDWQRQQHAVTVPPTHYVQVAMRGRKYTASVKCPGGRVVKAGTHATEDAAWVAGQRLAGELRSDLPSAA